MQVGDDEFGIMLVNVLKDNHVDTKGCVFDANARTALAFVTLRHDGEREFMFYRNPSADMLFEPHELDLALLQEVFSHHLLHSSTTHTHQCLCIVPCSGGFLWNHHVYWVWLLTMHSGFVKGLCLMN